MTNKDLTNFAIVMVTADRSPGPNYLSTTLNRLRGCHIKNLTIFDTANVEWARDLIGDGIQIVDHAEPVCANINVADALDEAAKRGDWVLFIEDDVDFIDDFISGVVSWLSDHQSSLPVIYPLGANYPGVDAAVRNGESWWQYPIAQFYGTQSFAIRSRDVAGYTNYIREHCYDLHDDGTGYDHLIRDYAITLGITYFTTPAPSFVQHIGITSVIKQRGNVHTFPSWPGREWKYTSPHSSKSAPVPDKSTDLVTVLTPFRNAAKYLPRYFQQLRDLQNALGSPIRLVAAEGDSVDGTRSLLIDYASKYNIALDHVPTDHGHINWSSVEDPTRLRCMSDVMNAALSRVCDDDEIVVWIMSDIEYSSDTIIELIDDVKSAPDDTVIFTPLTLNEDSVDYWDVWAYRGIDGERFVIDPPYHSSIPDVGLTELYSAGTCLVMSAVAALECRAKDNEAVSFCVDARNRDYVIYLDQSCVIRHKPISSKRVLFLGDPPFSPSGFGRCTNAVINELLSRDYEVDVIALGFNGDPRHNSPFHVWPANVERGEMPMGEMQLYRRVIDTKYDVVVVECDVWNAKGYLEAIEAASANNPNNKPGHVVGWVPVDSKNMLCADELNRFDQVVTYTYFGRDELIRNGCTSPVHVVPLGVDLEMFKPRNDEIITLTRDAFLTDATRDMFVIGVVGANQPRKRIDVAIKCYAQWLAKTKHPDTCLLLHSQISNPVGCDIMRMIQYYEIAKFNGHVVLPTAQLSKGGQIETVGALSSAQYALMLASFDVLLSTTLGEGWGLPVLEAMAVGVPTIVPRYSGLGEWAKGATRYVDCVGEVPNAPSNGVPFTMGGVVDEKGVVGALEQIYSDSHFRDKLTNQGLEMAQVYDWKRCAQLFVDAINDSSFVDFGEGTLVTLHGKDVAANA